jgi:hypothetical protein
MASRDEAPLFRMLWCVSVAPLGLPVVPLVNWMLMASWHVQHAGERVQRARSARGGHGQHVA